MLASTESSLQALERASRQANEPFDDIEREILSSSPSTRQWFGFALAFGVHKVDCSEYKET
jgi:hypothetical protein